MHETVDDLAAPWTRHGPELARRMLALADELDGRLDPGSRSAACLIRAVVRCEYDPTLESRRSQLGDPPTKAAGSRTLSSEPGS